MAKTLRRSGDMIIAGVCAGIADYFGVDRSIIRIATVILAVFTGIFPLSLCYLICCLVVPGR
ncbi:MAG: PspC domain-containing protein [Bacteroidales bacterium]|jgi:phage shock protein C|nr:PspC domain-containing protein [Bacteroidales bacterium]